jgi:rhodanese-related sulfurtransferase
MKTTAKQIGIILLASAVVAVVANRLHPQRIPWVQDWSRQVEAQAVKQDIKVIPLTVALGKLRSGESIFVDARSGDHFAQGHIPGAVSVPFDRFDELFSVLVDLIDSGRELVVYCRNRECDDALLLAIELRAMGCSNAVLYIDGFDFWKEHGGVTSSSPVDSGDAVTPKDRQGE